MADLAKEWREDALRFRKYGAVATAEILEAMAVQLEAHVRERELEELTLEQAVAESGKSYSTIQKMVARGELENIGRKNAPRVRRGDLPKTGKGRKRKEQVSIADLAIYG